MVFTYCLLLKLKQLLEVFIDFSIIHLKIYYSTCDYGWALVTKIENIFLTLHASYAPLWV
jgi:hypothetical protein